MKVRLAKVTLTTMKNLPVDPFCQATIELEDTKMRRWSARREEAPSTINQSWAQKAMTTIFTEDELLLSCGQDGGW